MPRIKSAKKALRQNVRHRTRNRARKSHIKIEIKNFRKLIGEKKLTEAAAAFPNVMQAVDKVAKSGYIKKGKANRIKSRLAKKLAVK
jgi:small subunit ribosomal protein S20